MRGALWIGLGIALLGCGEDDNDGAADAAVDAVVMVEALTCDEVRGRAILPDPPANLDCAGEPEFVTVGRIQMFKYEASHPMASAERAFPCSNEGEIDFQAPQIPTQPCSVADVRPWHSIKWADADIACKAIGWRLCTGEELIRSCGGEDGQAFAYGNTFSAGSCNVREAHLAEGAETASMAPVGSFTDCESPSGAFDVNGNLWEWNNDRDASDARARTYQGAGWRTVAQRHQDSNQQCNTTTLLRGFSAPSYKNDTVGFRCCRSAP